MRLHQLLRSIGEYRLLQGREDIEIEELACDSREEVKGALFFCLAGTNYDGHIFIRQVLEKGAVAAVIQSDHIDKFNSSRQDFPEKTIISVSDSHRALLAAARCFYDYAPDKMKIVAVTGTNGKTTVTYLLEEILSQAGFKVGVIGTINYRYADNIVEAHNTTPGPLQLERLFFKMQKEGIEWVAMEVSSHALRQGRTDAVNFHSAIFTNLTQDHLDYHRDMEDYFLSKAKLFVGLGSSSWAVINADDPYGRRLKEMTPVPVIMYGMGKDEDLSADIRAEEIKITCRGSAFLAVWQGKEKLSVKSALVGRHNVYNILAVLAWGLREGIERNTLLKAIEAVSFIPGRLQRKDSPVGFSVFIDYAHTDDALKNVLGALRELGARRIIVVFGCGGDRDRTKRPKMGYVVTQLADWAIITNDNPRSEDPLQIIEDIKKGIQRNNFSVIPDRYAAIKEAIRQAKKGDVVLVAGKGHEKYQIIGDRKEPFDDAEVVEECLRSLSF